MPKTKQKPQPAAADVAHIHEQLRPLALHVDELNDNPDNARDHGEDSLTALISSYQQFGQRKPVVVRKETMQIEAGHGTVQAFKALGWDYVAVVLADDDEDTARAFGLADNRTAELSEWNDENLALELEKLSEAGFPVSGLGWDDDDLDKILDVLKEETEAAPDVYEGDEVGKTYEEKLDTFEAGVVRQIMLTLDAEQHLWATKLLGKLMLILGHKNFTDVFVDLLKRYEDGQIPTIPQEVPEGGTRTEDAQEE